MSDIFCDSPICDISSTYRGNICEYQDIFGGTSMTLQNNEEVSQIIIPNSD
jgi:hypothetical protein